MLILTRRPGERVMIGDAIAVTLLSVDGQRVRLGIDAPRSITIDRGEFRHRNVADADRLDTETSE